MAKKSSGQLPDFVVSVWNGLDNSTKNQDDMKSGSTPDSLNWITGAAQKDGTFYGDHIELRRGTSFLQSDAMPGNNPITGLGVGIKQDGTQIPVFSTGRSLYYYDVTSGTNIEIGTNILPVEALGEDVTIIPYQSLSGYYLIISSANSSIYKLNTANLGSLLDFQSFDLRGRITTNQGRVFLWGREGKTGKDLINLYISYIDAANYEQSPPIYPQSGIVGTATDGTTKGFSGTFTLTNAFRSIFNVQIAAPIAAPFTVTNITQDSIPTVTVPGHNFVAGDIITFSGITGMTQINNLIGYVVGYVSVNSITISINTATFTAFGGGGVIAKCEQFTDDQGGNLKSNQGGTGTINYVTGAYTVNFITAPITGYHVVASYFEDDSSESLAKFLLTAPAAAGEGDFVQQPGFGKLMNVVPIAGLYFCFHEFGTYQMTITDNDVTKLSQDIYRNNVGIPYWRAAYPTSDGIPYLDTLNSASPKLRLLTTDYSVSNTNPAIIPKPISDQIDLSQNSWDKGVVFEWGDYYPFSGKAFSNGVSDSNNDNVYFYNKKTGIFDRTDYRANCFATYYGALIAGDSISPNVQVLFSGFDDLGYNINNYYKSPYYLLGWKGMKKFNRFVIKGLIQPSQKLEIWLSYDNGSQYVLFATIDGNSDYVNKGIPYEVGGQVVGSNIVGGGGVVNAFPYEAEFKIASDLFNRVSFKLIATQVGYVSTDYIRFADIRLKSSRIINNFN